MSEFLWMERLKNCITMIEFTRDECWTYFGFLSWVFSKEKERFKTDSLKETLSWKKITIKKEDYTTKFFYPPFFESENEVWERKIILTFEFKTTEVKIAIWFYAKDKKLKIERMVYCFYLHLPG